MEVNGQRGVDSQEGDGHPPRGGPSTAKRNGAQKLETSPEVLNLHTQGRRIPGTFLPSVASVSSTPVAPVFSDFGEFGDERARHVPFPFLGSIRARGLRFAEWWAAIAALEDRRV